MTVAVKEGSSEWIHVNYNDQGITWVLPISKWEGGEMVFPQLKLKVLLEIHTSKGTVQHSHVTLKYIQPIHQCKPQSFHTTTEVSLPYNIYTYDTHIH